MIYLDYNAASPLRPEARQALLANLDLVGNASSVHQYGRRVRKAIEDVRDDIAHTLKTQSRHLVFTSGATEANNMVLRHFPGAVIVSAIEHDATRLVRPDAQICPVDDQGLVKLEALQKLLAVNSGPQLLSIMHANNETGVIQFLPQIIDLAKAYGALVHTDGAQIMGKESWDFDLYPVDYVTFSGSKLGALQGVGVVAMNGDRPLIPLQVGGGQERYYRPGTENVMGIVSLGVAFKAALNDNWQPIAMLRDDLERRLMADYPEIHIFAGKVRRLPNTSNLTMPGVKSETQVMHFDMKGIAVSAGSACSSGKVQVSPVLEAMGVSPDVAGTALRLSMGPRTSADDLMLFTQAWRELYERCR